MKVRVGTLKGLIRGFGGVVLSGSLLAVLLGSTHVVHPQEGVHDMRFLFYFGLAGIASGVGLLMLRRWAALIVVFVGQYYLCWVTEGITRVPADADAWALAVQTVAIMLAPGAALLRFWRLLK